MRGVPISGVESRLVDESGGALRYDGETIGELALLGLTDPPQLGERILGSPGYASVSLVSRFGSLTLQAVTGWFCIGVPSGILLYLVLSCGLRRRRQSHPTVLESPA